MADPQAILARAQQAIDAGNVALARGQSLIQSVQQRVQQIEDAWTAEQQAIDEEIHTIVDGMDEETVRLVGELETLDDAI